MTTATTRAHQSKNSSSIKYFFKNTFRSCGKMRVVTTFSQKQYERTSFSFCFLCAHFHRHRNEITHNFQVGDPGMFSTETRVFRVTTRRPVAWMAFVSTLTQPTWQQTKGIQLRSDKQPTNEQMNACLGRIFVVNSHRSVWTRVLSSGDGPLDQRYFWFLFDS